jgi:hypothetical protein
MDKFNPEHYKQGKLETYEIIDSVVPDFESYLLGNVLKYISRYKHKNGIEDLKKAIVYINKIIEQLQIKDNYFDEDWDNF